MLSLKSVSNREDDETYEHIADDQALTRQAVT